MINLYQSLEFQLKKTKYFRFICAFMSACIFLTSCSQNGFVAQQLAQTDVVKKIVTDHEKHQRMVDRHKKATNDSELNDMNFSHIKRVSNFKNSSNDSSGGGPEISTARRNGKNVAMFDAWAKAGSGSSYIRISYFIFTFFNNDVMESGKIPLHSNDSPTYSEVWRYFNGSWCAVIPQIKVNITAADAASLVFNENDSSIRAKIVTGSNDGVFGEIQFIDTDPYDQDCLDSEGRRTLIKPVANPQDSSDKSFYRSYYDYETRQLQYSMGSINKIKVFKHKFQNTLPDTSQYGQTRSYFLAISNQTCPTGYKDSDSANCDEKLTSGSDLWLGTSDFTIYSNAFKPTIYPGYGTFHRIISGQDFKANTLDGDLPVPISDAELKITGDDERNYIDFNVATTFGRKSTLPVLIQGRAKATLTQYDIYKGGVDNILFITKFKADQFSKENYATFVKPIITQAQSSNPKYPAIGVLALPMNSPVPTRSSSTTYNLPRGPVKCVFEGLVQDDKCTEIVSDLNTSDVVGSDETYLNLQVLNISKINLNTSTQKRSLQLTNESQQNFYGNTAVTTSLENDYTIKQRSENRQFSIPPLIIRSLYAENKNDPQFKKGSYLKISGINSHPLDKALIGPIPNQFFGLDSYAQFDENNADESNIPLSLAIKDVNSTVFQYVKVSPQGERYYEPMAYITGRFSDDLDITLKNNSRRTKGGVFLCVAKLKSDGSPELSSCSTPRLSSKTELTTGYVLASTAAVTGAGNDSTAPTKLTMTQSPSGAVYINYFTSLGAIYTVNATNAGAAELKNWTRIRTGQVSECSQTFTQIKKEVQEQAKPQSKHSGFWGKLLKTVVIALAIAVIATLAPEGMEILVATQFDTIAGMIEWSAEKDSDDSKDGQDVAITNDSKIETSCKVEDI